MYVVGGLLIITNAFWAWQVHRLLNKLMSRNYGEYKASSTIEPKKDHTLTMQEPSYPDDLGTLRELQF